MLSGLLSNYIKNTPHSTHFIPLEILNNFNSKSFKIDPTKKYPLAYKEFQDNGSWDMWGSEGPMVDANSAITERDASAIIMKRQWMELNKKLD